MQDAECKAKLRCEALVSVWHDDNSPSLRRRRNAARLCEKRALNFSSSPPPPLSFPPRVHFAPPLIIYCGLNAKEFYVRTQSRVSAMGNCILSRIFPLVITCCSVFRELTLLRNYEKKKRKRSCQWFSIIYIFRINMPGTDALCFNILIEFNIVLFDALQSKSENAI